MNKTILLLFIAIIALTNYSNAQPKSFKYQAVARGLNWALLVNKALILKLSIRTGSATGNIEYSETHNVTTNPYGLFTIDVGSGTPVTSNFNAINWNDAAQKYIQTELNLGSGFLDMGASKLLSVPYALNALEAKPGGPAGGGLTGNYPNPAIANKAVSLEKMTDIPTSSIMGRSAAGTGVPEVLSVAETKAMLAINNIDNTRDANKPISTTTQTELNLKANSVSPTFTGTVVLPATTSVGTTTATELGYLSGLTSPLQNQINALGGAAVNSVSGISNRIISTGGANPSIDIAPTYTGQTSITTLGTVTTGTWNADPIGATKGGAGAVLGVLKANGSGTVSAAVAGTDYSAGTHALASGILKSTTGTGTLTTALTADFPILNQNTTGNAATVTTNANLTGEVTSTGNATTIAAGVITTAKIADGNVTLAKMANIATASILGRSTASSGVPEVLSASTTKTLLALNNLDNTSDANKPVSTAAQTALDLKANLAAPTFTGAVVLPSTTTVGSTTSTELGYLSGVTSAIQTQLNNKGAGTVTSVTGTANRISSSGGTTPAIDIAATYVGQTSITTLGTVATGTWNADVIGATKGGAGAVSGIMKANGSGTVSAATAGTDYSAGTQALATGLLKSTTTTGALSIATSGTDYLTPSGSAASLTSFPTLNQNTTGNAATATLASTVTTNANLTGDVTSSGNATTYANVVPAAKGGAGAVSGVLKANGLGTVSAATAGTDYLTPSGSAASLTAFPTLNQNTTGNAATATLASTVTTNANLTGDVTSSGNATTYGNVVPAAKGGAGAVTGILKANGSGTVSAATAGTDYLTPSGSAASLTAFPTLNQNTTGNAATATLASTVTTNANLTGDVTSSGNTATYNNVVPATKGGAGAVSGVLKANGSGTVSAATAGTDYSAGTQALATGLLKSTTSTGALTIATAGTDYLTPSGSAASLTAFPTLNQNTTGNAATATLASTVTTNANLTGDVTSSGNTATYNNVVPATKGGAGAVSGVLKANGSGTVSAATAGTDYSAGTQALATGILKSTTSTGALTIATAGTDYLTPSGSAAALTSFPTLNQNTTGNAATATLASTVITNANLTGNVTSSGNATTIASLPAISGASLTTLNAAELSSGTVPLARLGSSGTASATTFLRGDNTWATPAGGGGLSAGSTSGQVYLTGASGAVPTTPVSVTGDISITSGGVTAVASLPAISGANLTSLNAGNLGSGTLPAARMPALTGAVTMTAGTTATTLADNAVTVAKMATSGTLPAFNGSALTNLDASDLATGTVPTARMGSGTASATTYLRGDNTWATPTSNTSSTSLTLVSRGVNTGTTGSFYFSPVKTTFSNLNANSSVTAEDAIFVMPFACTVSSIQVGSTTTQAGSAGADVTTFTVMKNGAATSMTCSVTNTQAIGGGTSSSDTTNTFTVAAGDTITIRFSESNNGGGTAPFISYSIVLRTQ